MADDPVRLWTTEDVTKLNDAFDRSPFFIKLNGTRRRRRWGAFFRLFRSIRFYEKVWGRDLDEAFDRMFDGTDREQVWRRLREIRTQSDRLLIPLDIRLRVFKNHGIVVLHDGWDVS